MEDIDPAQAQQGLDHGLPFPALQMGWQSRAQALNPLGSDGDGLLEFFEDQLLGGAGHLQARQVIEMSGGPTALARITKIQAQEKAFETLASHALIFDGAEA